MFRIHTGCIAVCVVLHYGDVRCRAAPQCTASGVNVALAFFLSAGVGRCKVLSESYRARVRFVAGVYARVNEQLVSGVERSPASRAVRPAAVEQRTFLRRRRRRRSPSVADVVVMPPASSLSLIHISEPTRPY